MKRLRACVLVAATLSAQAVASAAQDPSAPVFDENVVATFTLSMSAGDHFLRHIPRSRAGLSERWVHSPLG